MDHPVLATIVGFSVLALFTLSTIYFPEIFLVVVCVLLMLSFSFIVGAMLVDAFFDT